MLVEGCTNLLLVLEFVCCKCILRILMYLLVGVLFGVLLWSLENIVCKVGNFVAMWFIMFNFDYICVFCGFCVCS